MEHDPGRNPTPGPDPPELPVFQHPEWMVGIVLISGVLAIVAGLLNPVWWLAGSPCILALGIWIYGRIRTSLRVRRGDSPDF